MSKNAPTFRIGVYGTDDNTPQPVRGCCLWSPGYTATITAATGIPVPLQIVNGCDWNDILEGVDGVVFAESLAINARQQAEEDKLCRVCRELGLPILAVDQGLHILNATFGGTNHTDLYREVPEAIQHRQPPEPGVRHAINVIPGTQLAEIYGEGEIVVNSEHRGAINRLARGFKVGATALDGVIEAVEFDSDSWFAMGVQWHPASATASGLDIQLFRALLDGCARRAQRRARPAVQTVAA